PIQFTAVWLFYVEELSIRQIAAVIGKSESAVKTILCRARKVLVHRLRAYAKFNTLPVSEDEAVSPERH
ncbi:MAG TPA: sigma-70 region 4 domain-containing protein, partial [Thermogutta sp.]|nr:sigma-70 region 4 domain-containing protein [Thermogutta sp.]